jgi:hypothetical protein
VSHEGIISGQREATLERLKDAERVLLIQDTTSFNFHHHPATKGLGPLENEYTNGFLAHTTLAVSSGGVPVGVVDQQVWVRSREDKGKRQQRHERDFIEKESYKWVKGLPDSDWVAQLPAPVVVCDAEAHIYDLLGIMLSQGLDFVIRAADSRSFTPEGQSLFKAVSQQAVQHEMAIDLKRRPDREARTAALELRFGQINLKRPRLSSSEWESITVYVVDVFEPDPPLGEAAVHWLLLTSLVVESIQQAVEVVTFYLYRWLVERFHYTLKSGCQMEEKQLRTADRLQRLLAVYSIVAWQLLWLTYQARQTPDAPCTLALTTPQWQALYAFVQRTTLLPQSPPSLREVVRWIGQLGGFIGRKGDGEPGVKVLWRGWSRLLDITDMWLLSYPSRLVGNG